MKTQTRILAILLLFVGIILAPIALTYGPLAFRGTLVEDDTEPGGFCAVHHIPYAVEVIPVHYGYPIIPKRSELTETQRNWEEEEHAAWSSSFPYSHLASGAGGCVVRPAKFAKVSYCPKCRIADEEWHAKHLPPAKKQNRRHRLEGTIG